VGTDATFSSLQPQRANNLDSYPADGNSRHDHTDRNVDSHLDSFAFAYAERSRLADSDAYGFSDPFSDSSIYPARVFQNRVGFY
jgi:hypothetical protein